MKFLFDLGGVFFDWDPHYFYKDVIEDKEERDYFLNNICNDEWNIQQDAGRLIKDAETDLIKTYPDYEDKIKLYYKNHHKMFRKIFQYSVDVLDDLKNKKYLKDMSVPGMAVGKTGLERKLDEDIIGKVGFQRYEVNAFGKRIKQIQVDPGQAGKSFKTTLDIEIQKFTKEVLKDKPKKNEE